MATVYFQGDIKQYSTGPQGTFGVLISAINNDIGGWRDYSPTESDKTKNNYVYDEDGKAIMRYSKSATWLDIVYEVGDEGYMDFTITIPSASPAGLTTRSASLYVTGILSDSSTVEITYTVTQFGRYQTIWSEKEQYVPSNLHFKIYESLDDNTNELLFEGKMPGDAVIDWSPICRDFFQRYSLGNPSVSEDVADPGITKILTIVNVDTDKVVNTIPYIYNYTYKDTYIGPKTTLLNKPINGKIIPYTYPTFTIFNGGNGIEVAQFKNGEAVETLNYTDEYSTVQTAVSKFESMSNEGDYIAVGDSYGYARMRYDVICGEWGMYYLNKYGAYDIFIPEGNVRVYDNYNKTSYTSNTSATDIDNRIETDYEIVTGWITDEQSEILAEHLLPSLSVYLTHFDERIPVNITNSRVERKQFRNGKNLNQYTITCKASKYKINR